MNIYIYNIYIYMNFLNSHLRWSHLNLLKTKKTSKSQSPNRPLGHPDRTLLSLGQVRSKRYSTAWRSLRHLVAMWPQNEDQQQRFKLKTGWWIQMFFSPYLKTSLTFFWMEHIDSDVHVSKHQWVTVFAKGWSCTQRSTGFAHIFPDESNYEELEASSDCFLGPKQIAYRYSPMAYPQVTLWDR